MKVTIRLGTPFLNGTCGTVQSEDIPESQAWRALLHESSVRRPIRLITWPCGAAVLWVEGITGDQKSSPRAVRLSMLGLRCVSFRFYRPLERIEDSVTGAHWAVLLRPGSSGLGTIEGAEVSVWEPEM